MRSYSVTASLLAVSFSYQTALAFSPVSSRRPVATRLTSAKSEEEVLSANDVLKGAQLKGAQYLELEVFPHKPLGCTAEESLADGDYVFVSTVKPGGNAELAGMETGDVIVGVTGLFGEFEEVVGSIDKVKGLVAARPGDEPLILRIARGTTIPEEHERALVELCSDPTLDGKESEECIVAFLKDGYNMDREDEIEVIAETDNENSDKEEEEEEAEDDNLVADLYNMWAEDLESTMPIPEIKPMPEDTEEPKVKPWSSRSSLSGTYVRDPTTGDMRNIDA